MPDGKRHPNDYDLYTPITPELLDLLVRMRSELGSWREVAATSGTRLRVLRRIYRLERKAISQKLLDRLCTTVGVGSIREFTWFTADDLVALGIWDPIGYDESMQLSSEERVERRRQKSYARRRAASWARRQRRKWDDGGW